MLCPLTPRPVTGLASSGGGRTRRLSRGAARRGGLSLTIVRLHPIRRRHNGYGPGGRAARGPILFHSLAITSVRQHPTLSVKGLSCLVAEHCWDQARWAIEAYAWRFDGLERAPRTGGTA